MEKPFSAYKGTDPFVFVCYAHSDSEAVYKDIALLHQKDVNIWYDEGIPAGSSWRTEIATAISGASKLLFFISARSLASGHCMREVRFALDNELDILPVYLENCELPVELALALGGVHALYRDTDDLYIQHLEESAKSQVEPAVVPLRRVRQQLDAEEPGQRSFFQELRRRRVFSTTAAYVIGAWVLIEAAELVFETFDAPEMWLQLLLIVFVVLTPFVMVLAWFFQITPEGIVNTDRDDRRTRASRTVGPSATSYQHMRSDSAAAVALEEQSESDNAAEKEALDEGAERRLVSVLQCSISALDGDFDDEEIEALHKELPDVIQRFTEIVEMYDGMCASVESEQITAYFGVKVAHEDDTARAFLSAEEMLRFVEIYNVAATEAGSGLKLAISVGLHSGFAVVEESTEKSADLWVSNIGAVLKTTAALQLGAAANEIRFSHPVYRVVSGSVECESLGDLNLGGGNRAKYYSVDLDSLARRERGITAENPLVGRMKEVAVLQESWELAQSGVGQVILVRGEPGIGKTKLIAAVSAPIIFDPAVRGFSLECSAYRVHTPFFPIVQFLRSRILKFDGSTPESALKPAVEKMLLDHNLESGELLPVMLSLISPEQSELVSELPSEKQKELLQQALLAILLAQHDERPGFILVEDLHWADPSTLELLELFIAQLSAERCMLLMTCRPTFKSNWTDYSVVSLLTINRLGDEQAREVISSLDPEQAIGEDLTAAIIDKSDGVPLYLEEYTASVLEAVSQGTSIQNAIAAIPNTLQELLTARLHHLGPAKTLLHLGATIGREFAHTLLLAASDLPAHSIPSHLDELMARELIHRRGLGAKASHVFRHALIQEAAYNSMLKSKREECHLNIARVLEEQMDSTGDQNMEVLAYHYARAEGTEENLDKAIGYWQRAAAAAARSYSNQEAYSLLENALTCLKRLPENEIRNNRELQILASQMPVLIAMSGYATEEMAKTTERALALCADEVDVQLRFLSLFIMSAYYIVSAEHNDALVTSTRMQKLAESEADENNDLKLEAYVLVGIANFFLGHLNEAEKYLRSSLDFYRPEDHQNHAFEFGQDPDAVALSYLNNVYFSAGNFAQLEKSFEQLKDRGNSSQHPISRSYCFLFAGWKHMHMEEYSDAGALIDEALRVTEEHGLTNFANHAAIISNLHQFELSGEAALIDDIDAAFADFRSDGSRCLLTSWESYYVRACIQTGMLERAEEVAKRMESDYKLTGERWAQSEMIRARALLEEAKGKPEQAIELLRSSVDAADAIGAYGLSLRSACDLCERLSEKSPDESRAILQSALENIPEESRKFLPERPRRLAAELDITPR